jgi:hypothetical protein
MWTRTERSAGVLPSGSKPSTPRSGESATNSPVRSPPVWHGVALAPVSHGDHPGTSGFTWQRLPGVAGLSAQHRVADVARVERLDRQAVGEDGTRFGVPAEERLEGFQAADHGGIDTRGAETAEVARALVAQKICEAEHGSARKVFDREVN